MKKHIIISTSIFIFLLGACNSIFGKQSGIEINLAKWESQKVSHYRFKLEIVCLCDFHTSMPVTIEVEDDQIVLVLDVNGATVNKTDRKYFDEAGTMERLFAIAKNSMEDELHHSTIEYDDQFRFPSLISCYETQSDYEGICDGTPTYKVSDFEVLP